MANTYCTATNFGKGFFTHEDRNDFYLSGHAGDVWVVGNNAAGVSWINRVSGTGKTAAEAQAIVDGKIEEGQVEWDASSAEHKAEHSRPTKYTLPQELTMANYKGIKGFKVQSLASDPTASSDTEGKVWYNTTGDALKYVTQGGGAWASAPALNAARGYAFGMGASSATLCIGGQTPAPVTGTVIVESFDGSSWTEVGDLNTGRSNVSGGMGTQTAGIVSGAAGPGNAVTNVAEEWNGTSWTEIADLTTPRGYGSTSTGGTPTAALVFGGGPSPSGLTITETWNGTSWTEVADLNFARFRASGAGTSTAALVVGDANAPEEDKTETWNGASWTAANDINGGGYSMGGGGRTSSAAFVVGGTPEAKRRGVGTSNTEHFNGTSWTEVGDVASPLEAGGSGGSTTSAMEFGGYNNPGTASATFEWADPTYTVKTVTVT